MFDLNPLNLPDAQMQQWVMMIVAGMLGFIIGYVSHQKNISQLEGNLRIVKNDLDACHRSKIPPIELDDRESVVLDRIRTRSGEINFARIGVASAAIADDLKEITGIGPFLEKKLHASGIYTFRQIANFTKEDVDKVNDIIEFFPGRIERDKWVGQAAERIKKT